MRIIPWSATAPTSTRTVSARSKAAHVRYTATTARALWLMLKNAMPKGRIMGAGENTPKNQMPVKAPRMVT